MKTGRILVIVLSVLIVGSGCGTRTVFICPTLPEPPRPTLPNVEPGALDCISDDAAEALNESELRLIEYAEELEVIISTHNKHCRERRPNDE